MLRILICDDAVSYQEILSYKVNRILSEELHIEAELQCVSGVDELRTVLSAYTPDILFLDVMLEDKNSIDLLAQNKMQYGKTQIILMTAYPIEAYNLSEVSCCYYLIKSRLTDEQLARALKKAVGASAKKAADLELVKIGSKTYTINFQDILFIETFNNNIVLHMADGSTMNLYTTLKHFSKRLPASFLRCHKSYMVNMNHVLSYEPHQFRVTTRETVPIPPKKYAEITELYRKYMKNF